MQDRPKTWTRRRRSPRNHDNANREQSFPPTPPRTSRSGNNDNDDNNDRENDRPPSPPRRSKIPPLRRESANTQGDRDYIAENVGDSLYDLIKVFGLGFGASETEVNMCIYHPDKHDPTKTGMSNDKASDFFKLINNAQAYLREVL